MNIYGESQNLFCNCLDFKLRYRENFVFDLTGSIYFYENGQTVPPVKFTNNRDHVLKLSLQQQKPKVSIPSVRKS